MDGNLRQTLVVDFGETKRKSCETKARDLFEDGLDEEMVRSQLKQEYSKAQVSKALAKIRNSDGNFQEANWNRSVVSLSPPLRGEGNSRILFNPRPRCALIKNVTKRYQYPLTYASLQMTQLQIVRAIEA